MISIALGAVLFFAQIHLPEILNNTLSIVGNMIGPASMIVTGMLFAGMDLKKIFGNKRVYIISSLRMIVIPLIALALIKLSRIAALSSDAPKIMLIVFLAMITPSASTVTQICQVYGNDAKYASAINVVTTLCAIVTMPLMVLLYTVFYSAYFLSPICMLNIRPLFHSFQYLIPSMYFSLLPWIQLL